MTLSVPLLIGIVVAAVVIGLLLGRRRRQVGVIRPPEQASNEAGVRVIRPPMPNVPAGSGAGASDPAGSSALADAINRASDNAHIRLHITPEMLANAKVTSNVHVSTSEGTLDAASAKQMMDAVSRLMAAGGGEQIGELSPEGEREVRALVERGRMVEAVKRVRELTGLGLKDAKDIAEALR